MINPTRCSGASRIRTRTRRWCTSSASAPSTSFSNNLIVDAEYVGNRTRHGRKLRNLNEGILTNPGVGPVVFPYAQYGFGTAYLEQIVTNGVPDYDALQIRCSAG